MTVEKKTLISFRDILAVEYGCPKCGSKYTIPVEKFEQAFPKCPNCKSALVNTEGFAPEDATIRNFVLALRELTSREFSKALRLQITNVPERPQD
jgi:NAD-dependent SIR2 family protein deacetylase